MERFTNSDFADKFHRHVWDGIATYQFDLKTDKEQIIELTKKIIEVVYEKEVSKIGIDEIKKKTEQDKLGNTRSADRASLPVSCLRQINGTKAHA
ncbi:MAG: hypothetical protein GY705_11760 [Bacteroidetes bacterium]|nr:hypothetical protein [Bacteroidota bacterium]